MDDGRDMSYSKLTKALKHLAGMHDQKSHGRANGVGALREEDFPPGSLEVERSAVRKFIKSTGLDENALRAVWRTATFQPLISTYAGNAVIESVARIFNSELTSHEKAEIADNTRTVERGFDKKRLRKMIRDDYKVNGNSYFHRPLEDQDMDKLVRQIYSDTQDYLAERGIEQVKVYRGSKVAQSLENTVNHASLDPKIPEKFGTVREYTVPAKQVLSVPMTGFGVPEQYEVLVLSDAIASKLE